MSLLNGFSVDGDYGTDSFKVLPDGVYRFLVTEGNEVKCFEGEDKQLELQMQVIEGEHKGHNIREWYNTNDPDPEYRKKAMRRVQGLCRATGVHQLLDGNVHASWNGKTFIVKVTCGQTKAGKMKNYLQYPGKNEVIMTSLPPAAAANTTGQPWAR
jgi:hypothetical protein